MTDECISPLRRRMIEDMTVRNFLVKTQTDYIRRVKSFAVFLGRSPDTATREDVRRYLLHLASSYQNKAVIYDLLFKASSQTMLTIAADPKRLGVKIGFTSVLHTWGSTMTHHPHVHNRSC